MNKINLNKLFEIESEEIKNMDREQFFKKTKDVLEKIYNAYSQGWQNRVLRDSEYPEESICDKCTGCGIFFENGDGEELECFRDNEAGDCFHRFCDLEQVGIDLEQHISDIEDLLSVNKVINTGIGINSNDGNTIL